MIKQVAEKLRKIAEISYPCVEIDLQLAEIYFLCAGKARIECKSISTNNFSNNHPILAIIIKKISFY